MEYSKKKVHSFIKCHGGKSRYARQYIELMDKSGCDTYCECYYGGGGVHLNIPAGTFNHEYIHDADEYIYKTISALIHRPHKVTELLRAWPYDPISFANAQRMIGSGIDYKHAAGYIARNRMSRSGLFKDFAQSDRERGGRMGDLNAYENFTGEYITGTIERLSYQGVKLFEPGCGLDAIRTLLTPRNRRGRCLFFLDPPYLAATRVTVNAYRKEVDRAHHVKPLNLLITTNYKHAKFYLCGYMSDLYANELTTERGWKLHTFDRPSDAGQTEKKARRVECLWESP